VGLNTWRDEMTHSIRVIKQSRREFNKQSRKATAYAGIPNMLLAVALSFLVFLQSEMLVLHPSKVYRINGVRCDEKEAAEFLLRNMQKSFERGQLMIAIQRGRAKFATRRRQTNSRKGILSDFSSDVATCKYGRWPIRTSKVEYVLINSLRVVETIMMKPIFSSFYTLSVASTGYVIVGTYK
jgi:hypothetical protein